MLLAVINSSVNLVNTSSWISNKSGSNSIEQSDCWVTTPIATNLSDWQWAADGYWVLRGTESEFLTRNCGRHCPVGDTDWVTDSVSEWVSEPVLLAILQMSKSTYPEWFNKRRHHGDYFVIQHTGGRQRLKTHTRLWLKRPPSFLWSLKLPHCVYIGASLTLVREPVRCFDLYAVNVNPLRNSDSNSSRRMLFLSGWCGKLWNRVCDCEFCECEVLHLYLSIRSRVSNVLFYFSSIIP